MSDIFETQLVAFAKKASRSKTHCTSEESTKIYLVVPFLALLGYDASDPAVLVPELGFEGTGAVDFAIMLDSEPAIAIEVRKVGGSLTEARGSLARCFEHAASVRLGIATNGILYEFFIDSEKPDVMDAEPFLTLDLDAIAAGTVGTKTLRLLKTVRCRHYEPEALVEQAYTALLHQRLRTLLQREFRTPSEPFCRNLLAQIGVAGVSAAQIDDHYRPIIKAAMDEAIVLPVAQALQDAADDEAAAIGNDGGNVIDTRAVTASEEIEVVEYIKRRLSSLARTRDEQAAAGLIGATDYIGKLAVHLADDGRARLLDYISMGGGRHRFVFPVLDREIVVERFEEIDASLIEAFGIAVEQLRSAA
jgi:hypothetical protein